MTSKTHPQAQGIDVTAEEKQEVGPDVTDGFFDGSSRSDATKADLAAMEDRWMRAEAEIANVRSRARRDVEETRQFAVQKFAADMVEAAENLRRALGSLPLATEGEPVSLVALRAGLAEIERGFTDTLGRNGVTAIDPTGQAFAADRHQAVGTREAPAAVAGTVLQALGPVWMLNGRLLRPAMVIVAKAPAAQDPRQS